MDAACLTSGRSPLVPPLAPVSSMSNDAVGLRNSRWSAVVSDIGLRVGPPPPSSDIFRGYPSLRAHDYNLPAGQWHAGVHPKVVGSGWAWLWLGQSVGILLTYGPANVPKVRASTCLPSRDEAAAHEMPERGRDGGGSVRLLVASFVAAGRRRAPYPSHSTNPTRTNDNARIESIRARPSVSSGHAKPHPASAPRRCHRPALPRQLRYAAP